jgi:hypothetical protein
MEKTVSESESLQPRMWWSAVSPFRERGVEIEKTAMTPFRERRVEMEKKAVTLLRE